MNDHDIKPADFTILSIPAAITLTCPHCGCDVLTYQWDEINVPERWQKEDGQPNPDAVWPVIECHECGGKIQLQKWEYD